MFLFITILAITAVTCQSPNVEIEAQVPSGGQTAISNLRTDLLAGVPGYFWGNLTTSDVENSCSYSAVDGISGKNANVVAGNQSFMEDLTVTLCSSQGCRSKFQVEASSPGRDLPLKIALSSACTSFTSAKVSQFNLAGSLQPRGLYGLFTGHSHGVLRCMQYQ